jgi:hypothetical protein
VSGVRIPPKAPSLGLSGVNREPAEYGLLVKLLKLTYEKQDIRSQKLLCPRSPTGRGAWFRSRMLGVRIPPRVPILRVPKAGSFGSESVKLVSRGEWSVTTGAHHYNADVAQW